MTKEREPGSMEDALLRVLGKLGMECACAATGRHDHYLRAVSDPDKPTQHLTVPDMLALDKAYIAAGGPGAPLWETAGRMLKARLGAEFSDAAAIGRVGQELAKEGGEAIAAMFGMAQPDADLKALKEGLRDLEELADRTSASIAAVRSAIAHRQQKPP